MICKTTRSHFEKFCTMRRSMGVSFLNSDLMGTKEKLTQMFMKDPSLDKIPTEAFVPYWNEYRKRHPSISLGEAVGVIKHSLIYQVIGAIPEFID